MSGAENKIYTKNAAYQRLETLKSNRNKRYKNKLFFVEGVRNINEAIKNKWHIVSLIYTDGKKLSDWGKNILRDVKTDTNYILTADLMSELSSKTDTSEIIALIEMREDNMERLEILPNSVFVLFDRPSNKGNLGTIIRSCDSFGATGLILTGHAIDLYDPDVISASMGSFFGTTVIRATELNEVFDFIDRAKTKYPSFKTIGTSAHGTENISDIDLTAPLLLMLGNEADGLSRAFKEYCDVPAKIQMAETSAASSLNVACAATVMLYEVTRQRTD